MNCGAFFQWGKMQGIRAFAMGDAAAQTAIVLLTNSNRGLRLMGHALNRTVDGEHPAIPWLRGCVTE